MTEEDGKATIEDGAIVIRVPLRSLAQIIEGAWALRALDRRWKLIDPQVFAKAMVREMNDEDEEGTTSIHRMFDRAINLAIEQGAEGIEEHEDQDA